jgi:hypothetical protein
MILLGDTLCSGEGSGLKIEQRMRVIDVSIEELVEAMKKCQGCTMLEMPIENEPLREGTLTF